jgi:hypothetical protein
LQQVYDFAKELSPMYFGESYIKLTKLKQMEWDKMSVTFINTKNVL